MYVWPYLYYSQHVVAVLHQSAALTLTPLPTAASTAVSLEAAFPFPNAISQILNSSEFSTAFPFLGSLTNCKGGSGRGGVPSVSSQVAGNCFYFARFVCISEIHNYIQSGLLFFFYSDYSIKSTYYGDKFKKIKNIVLYKINL